MYRHLEVLIYEMNEICLSFEPPERLEVQRLRCNFLGEADVILQQVCATMD